MTGNCINLSLQRFTLLGKTLAGFILLLVSTAANAAVEQEIQFVFNTFSFLVWGALIMWMCAGFTMLESGSVRTKNASVICLKNIGIYSIVGAWTWGGGRGYGGYRRITASPGTG